MNKRFIGTKDMAEYLDLNINTIRSWVWQKRIPYVKLGRSVKFDPEEIDKWLKDKRVKEVGW